MRVLFLSRLAHHGDEGGDADRGAGGELRGGDGHMFGGQRPADGADQAEAEQDGRRLPANVMKAEGAADKRGDEKIDEDEQRRRSDERRVGKECASSWRTRWSPTTKT